MKKLLKRWLIIVDMIWIHMTSMYTGTQIRTLDDDAPYFTSKSVTWLQNFLTKDMTVFEWGSGVSTIYFAKRVKLIISVEHHYDWYSKMKWYIWLKGIKNCQLKFIPPTRGVDTYNSEDQNYQGCSFKEYCRYIDTFPNNYFDMIVADGRARSSCLALAKNHVKIGGYILLDDAERKRYNEACALLLDDYERTDFDGAGPYANYEWRTSIFKRIK